MCTQVEITGFPSNKYIYITIQIRNVRNTRLSSLVSFLSALRIEKREVEQVGVEDDKGPMVGQHLEGARIKLLRTDLVRGSVCAGIASWVNSWIVRSRSLFYCFSFKKRKREYTITSQSRHATRENRSRNPWIESSRATKNRSCISNAIET